jgi:F-box protein 20
MVIESLGLYYHIECFRCYVCNIPLSSSFEGTDVRVRSNRLHCQNCFSDENGKEILFILLIITIIIIRDFP